MFGKAVGEGKGETHRSSSSGVRLDSATVLTVGDGRILECHTGNDVVALASDGTNRKAVSADTCHARNSDVISRRDGHAVILVCNI